MNETLRRNDSGVILELTRVLSEASLEDSPEAQVQHIVDSVSQVLRVEVCTLYLKTPIEDLALVASHGLTGTNSVIIPAGQGLVGFVANSRQSLNIADPEQHPDFLHLYQSNESQFHSFCGVPLVYRGRVTGVLVVQGSQHERFAAEEEAFLVTLAAHLALLVVELSIDVSSYVKENLRYEGISGAPGVAIGEALLRKGGSLVDAPDALCADIAAELQAWDVLREQVDEELHSERDAVQQVLGDNLAGIVDAHQLLLADPSLGERICGHIREGQSLPSALRNAIQYFSRSFQAMADPYLRARHEDVDQLGDKLYQGWLGNHESWSLEDLDSPVILMGWQISVSDIVSLPGEKLAGIVCFSGAALSHIAVFANALGIPAVMGVGAIPHLSDGEQIVVDGNTGRILRSPSPVVLGEYRALISTGAQQLAQLQSLSELPGETLDGTTIRLMANSGLQADVMPGLRNGADGIGLYRTEIPFMIRSSLPSEEEQVAVYQEVFDAYHSKPVYVRTLDIGGDKPLPYLPASEEENPALGWRGIRFTLDNLPLFRTQLRAILRAAAGRADVHLLLPMVSVTRELDRVIELVDEIVLELHAEGHAACRPPLGVMVEVPAAISLLSFWARKLDFVSIGSNDLSQYLLAIDRNNPLVAGLYDPLHPAVIHELARVVATGERCGFAVSLCGEMASDPVAVLLLIGLGIRSLSLSSAKLPLIKYLVRSVNTRDAEAFAQRSLELDTAAAIRLEGEATLARLGFDLANPTRELTKSTQI